MYAERLYIAATTGFNVETVEYKNISFTVWDVGGQDKVRSQPAHERHHVMSSCPAHLSSACIPTLACPAELPLPPWLLSLSHAVHCCMTCDIVGVLDTTILIPDLRSLRT